MIYSILSFFVLFSSLTTQANRKLFKEQELIYNIENEKISTQKAEKLVEKYQEEKTDILSLLFDYPNPSCLQVMKELRLQDKKTKEPHSDWRLIQVISAEEIYFESFYQKPSKKYILHKLSKDNKQFYHTTLTYNGSHPNPQQVRDLLEIIQKKTIS